MDKLPQISLQNTVTLKIDYLLNQELLLNNFQIIMDCLKDLQSQIHNHSSQIAGLNSLKQTLHQLNQQVKQNSSLLSNHPKNTPNSPNSNSHSLDQTYLDQLQKQINELKDRIAKGQGFTTQNTKDINLLMSDMKNAKQDIEKLKKQLNALTISNGKNGSNANSANSDKNLGKNGNLNQEVLNELNQQSKQHHQAIQKFEKEMDQMKNHIKNIENDITGLKTNIDQLFEDKKLEESANLNENPNSKEVAIDGKTLNEIMKKIQYLNKKAENIQSQVLNNTRCIHQLTQNADKTSEQLEQQKENINNIHLEIQEINKILEKLQNLNNNDNDNLMSEIQKLKDQYEKILKMVNAIKNNTKSQNDSIDDRNSGSNRNINSKISQDRSFKKRSDSVDFNGKIRQLADRIKHLQKLMESQNPQKLPPIGWKKPNQTSYNPQKSHKKQMAEMKNDLQIWIRSYIDSLNKGQGNLSQIELKIQEMKNNLGRKADHEGMKKGLAFLEGKITQLYMFLTEPDSEDAMIVRKGFNCLSCSKKVENLRGKLGPRMNWDNLNGNHGQTPPKAGFPKYADSNEKESI